MIKNNGHNIVDHNYLNLLTELYNLRQQGKGQRGDRTGTGTTSIFDYKMRIDMSEGRFPLLTTKKLHLRSIIHELLWFLQGGTNIKYLNDNGVTIWDEWADENGDLGPIYGKQWVDWGGYYSHGHWNSETNKTGKHWNGVNQIQQAVDKLKNKPEDRRILVSAWNVDEIPNMKLPPCHWAFEFYSEELTEKERYDIWFANNYETGMERHFDLNNLPDYDNEYYTPTPKRKLSLKWHQRSVDTFLGLPFNIASYALLLQMMAQQTDHSLGYLIGDLSNVHIYNNHWEYVEKQLKRHPYEFSSPIMKINKAKDIFSYKYEDFELIGYEARPNWKGVPIAV